MGIKAILEAKLKADAGVSAIVGTKVYDRTTRFSQDNLPLITYQLISSVPINHAVGRTDTASARFQINCVSTTAALADTLADAVEAALCPEDAAFWSDATTDPQVSSCHLTDRNDLPYKHSARNDSSQGWGVALDVEVFFNPNK